MFFCLPGYPADQYDFTIFACFWLCVPSREEKGGCVCDSLSRRVFVPFPDQSVQFPTVFSVLLHYDAGAVCFIDRERKVDRHEEKLSVSSDWRNDCLFRFPDISADYSGSAADFLSGSGWELSAGKAKKQLEKSFLTYIVMGHWLCGHVVVKVGDCFCFDGGKYHL